MATVGERWMAPSEVAARLVVDPETVRRWCELGCVPGAINPGPGGWWRIPRHWVDGIGQALRVSQVARMLELPERTIREWCRRGHIPGAVQIGVLGRWRIPAAFVVEWRKSASRRKPVERP